MRPAILAACCGAASSALNVTQVLRVQNDRTNWGDASIAMAGPADPILMLTSWVYKPALVEAYRPAKAGSAPVWSTNVSSEHTYETLYVTSTVPYGGAGAPKDPGVDTLIMFNEKPTGISGPLWLYGTSSLTGAALDGGKGAAWSLLLNPTSDTVNGWSPHSWMALSDDGAAGVAWMYNDSPTYSIVGFNGQSGALLWNNTLTFNASDASYAYR